MSEKRTWAGKVLAHGPVKGVDFISNEAARVRLANAHGWIAPSEQGDARAAMREVRDVGWIVLSEQGDVARAAMREGRDVEIVSTTTTGEASGRIVRVLRKVEVKANGWVDFIHHDEEGSGRVSLRGTNEMWRVCIQSLRSAARAYVDEAQVEVVSIDGGPVQVLFRRLGGPRACT